MFTDMSISEGVNVKFADYLQTITNKPSVNFNTLVLTAGVWPFSATQAEILPPVPLESCVTIFQEFYSKQHNGRKLTWMHHLSRVDLKLFGFDRRYEVSVSLYQMLVLFLFNEKNSCEVKEMQEKSTLSLADLKKHLKVNALVLDNIRRYLI
jgi:hypothetical protein